MTRHKAESFPPISTKAATKLILGSMPGMRSLEEQQYYAHPQNAFWKIMSALFDAAVDTYEKRVKLIRQNHLALWDVLKYCERTGSLDTNIHADTIEVNDFAAFLKTHPKITQIFCNGAKSEAEFKKRVWPDLPDNIKERIDVQRLPSTSPAHAGVNFKNKLKLWSVIKD